MAVLTALEIKRHSVPNLKALTRSIECRGGHGRGSTFKQRYTVMKHKWPQRRFHVTVAVYVYIVKIYAMERHRRDLCQTNL